MSNKNWFGFASLIDQAVMVLMFLVWAVVCGMARPWIDSAWGMPREFGMLAVYSAALILSIVTALVYKKARGGGGAHPRIFFVAHQHIALLLWGIVAAVAVSVVVEPLIEIFPDKYYKLIAETIGQGSWAIVMTVVAAPILEEVFFRGIIQEEAMKKWGPWAGLFFGAAVFSVVHAPIPQQMVMAFFISLVIGYVYMMTRSLFAVIVIHAFNNILAYIQMTLTNGEISTLRELISNDAVFDVIFWGSAAVCAVSLVAIIATIRKNNTQNEADSH